MESKILQSLAEYGLKLEIPNVLIDYIDKEEGVGVTMTVKLIHVQVSDHLFFNK